MIPYGRQDISQQDIDAVVGVLKSDFLTQGPMVPEFEKQVTAYCGAKYGVAVNSATSALHIACLALGVGPGDIVWTSPNTFVASANCALYCGAKIDFIDIDPVSYNISIAELQGKLELAERNGCLPKVVIPVHFAGQSCDMHLIKQLSERYGFKIIEDASHAIGGKHREQPIGNCRYSDVTVFSFHPVKIITTAEGGMLTTNHSSVAEKMLLLRSHGITRDPNKMHGEFQGPWYYEQIELGYNYRMTDLQAALGISQLKRLDEFVVRRQYLANRYHGLLQNLPIVLPKCDKNSYSSWHLYSIRLQLDKISKDRRQIFSELRDSGIGVNLHYIPVHTQPYYKGLGFKDGDFPQAEAYAREAITLPLYSKMSNEEQDRVVDRLTCKEAYRIE